VDGLLGALYALVGLFLAELGCLSAADGELVAVVGLAGDLAPVEKVVLTVLVRL
jgi:hypothetical protein